FPPDPPRSVQGARRRPQQRRVRQAQSRRSEAAMRWTEFAGAKSCAMVIDRPTVDPEIERVDATAARAQDLRPRRPGELQPAKQVSSDIARAVPPHAEPRGARRPVAGQPPPGANGGHAEA